MTESATATETSTATPRSASFDLQRVRYPEFVESGDSFEIIVNIKNLGGQPGTTTVKLTIGNVSQSVRTNLEPGSSTTLSFSLNESGGYPDVGIHEIILKESSTGDVLREFEIEIGEVYPNTIFVNPEGSNDNPGTRDSPLATVQAGIDRAQPGETVFVEPGQYFEMGETVRSGEPSNPITITGPAEAVISGRKNNGFTAGYLIRHSHIHITGTTIDGLQYPDRPDSLDSYIDYGIHTLPEQPSYLENLVLKPEGIGNVTGPMVKINFVKNAEIGEFRTIGPSGLRYMLGDGAEGFGEIVYVGNSPPVEFNAIELTGELEGLDTSNNIHIHHIDNSAGYHHSELVNTKLGSHDVLVEYCTDGGGSQNDEDFPSASVRFQSYDATVRWCDLSNGHGHGIEIVSWNADTAQKEKDPAELTEAERKGGTDNSAYGNRVMGFDDKSFSFPESEVGQGPGAQRYLCGNSFDSEATGSPEKNCPEEVPTGDGVGHLGGDSPWA